jgi:hypothetical protein
MADANKGIEKARTVAVDRDGALDLGYPQGV